MSLRLACSYSEGCVLVVPCGKVDIRASIFECPRQHSKKKKKKKALVLSFCVFIYSVWQTDRSLFALIIIAVVLVAALRLIG